MIYELHSSLGIIQTDIEGRKNKKDETFEDLPVNGVDGGGGSHGGADDSSRL